MFALAGSLKYVAMVPLSTPRVPAQWAGSDGIPVPDPTRSFSSCFLLVFCFIALAKRAGKLIGRSLIQCISCAVGIVMLCGVVHTEQALGGEGKYRGLDLILITKLITDTSNPY